jgi:hypothetical protein
MALGSSNANAGIGSHWVKRALHFRAMVRASHWSPNAVWWMTLCNHSLSHRLIPSCLPCRFRRQVIAFKKILKMQFQIRLNPYHNSFDSANDPLEDCP